ncbi:hypothetical protein TNCV_4782021 [Trichonephila clavipes]|nr:hypothetical protein TNCV_4782021 [Trichonephila clavipes]
MFLSVFVSAHETRPVVEMDAKICKTQHRRLLIRVIRYDQRLEQKGNNILKRFITADEAWLYYYDSTIKPQSSEWKHSSPTPKKAKTVKSAGKVMAIISLL